MREDCRSKISIANASSLSTNLGVAKIARLNFLHCAIMHEHLPACRWVILTSMHGRCRWGGRHSTYSLHRKKRKMPLSAQWSEQNYKWMQPSAKCLCWLHFSDKFEFNNKTTTLSYRLYALLAWLFCRAISQFVCLFKVCKRDSRLPLVLFNLSDVWWNPNVFNFTVSFIHSAGLHRCDGVRWPGYFELRPLTNFPPEQVWPPGPHIACEQHMVTRERCYLATERMSASTRAWGWHMSPMSLPSIIQPFCHSAE